MDRTQTEPKTNAAQRLRNQANDDEKRAVDILLNVNGVLQITDDDNRGSDPYNHTGSNTGQFKRPVR